MEKAGRLLTLSPDLSRGQHGRIRLQGAPELEPGDSSKAPHLPGPTPSTPEPPLIPVFSYLTGLILPPFKKTEMCSVLGFYSLAHSPQPPPLTPLVTGTEEIILESFEIAPLLTWDICLCGDYIDPGVENSVSVEAGVLKAESELTFECEDTGSCKGLCRPFISATRESESRSSQLRPWLKAKRKRGCRRSPRINTQQ